MSRMLRVFAIASLAGMLVTLALLTLVHRQIAIQGIIELAERSNIALAQTVLNAVRPELVDYLASADGPGSQADGGRALPPKLAEAITRLMEQTSVIRIKIYNRKGRVVFATRTAQIGREQADNPGFIAAMDGRVADTLIYRDTFNAFDKETEEDNLLQTYIPVRLTPTEPVRGVFEIYTDVNPLVDRNEGALFGVLGAAALILGSLYAFLLLLVGRAGRIIENQQQTIRERTATLELLSARMLNSQEQHKKKIAEELHEGLAQTLSAIKVTVEDSRQRIAAGNGSAQSLEAIVPALQSAIHEVRAIATELRPSSLDDLGLLPTLAWYCREFEQRHPGLHIEPRLVLPEGRIPPALKIVIYRIVESALDSVARHIDADRIDRVELALRPDNDAITLLIETSPAQAAPAPEADPESRFPELRERATLSGGEFSATRNAAGGVTLRASWVV